MSFLSKDGYINTPAFIELVRDIDKLAVTEQLKPTELYFSKKAIVRDDHPSKVKLDAAAFEKKRAQPIKLRKRAPASGSAVRMMVLLRNYKGLDQFADYWKDYQLAVKAIERHNAKADKAIASIKTTAAKNRDKANATFDKNIDSFINEVLGEDAVEGEDYVVGTSMMGKTLMVKLPNGGVVSIGKSDVAKFDKAVEALAAPAPAKPAAKKVATAPRAVKAATKVAPVAKAPVKKTAAATKATPVKSGVKKAAATVSATVKKALKPVPAKTRTVRR